MQTLAAYLQQYESAHRNPTNVGLHTVCVPLIFWSVFAFLHTFSIMGEVTAGHAAALLTLALYSTFKNVKLIAIMSLIFSLILWTAPLIRICAGPLWVLKKISPRLI